VAVGGAIDGLVVNGHQAGIFGELQIGFYESYALRDGFAERGQSVLRGVAAGAAMGDQEHGFVAATCMGFCSCGYASIRRQDCEERSAGNGCGGKWRWGAAPVAEVWGIQRGADRLGEC
jgi:hypothetical protein